ncbi:MAG: cupredoxin domain-containing protein [Mycobacteriales bacterium]|nr:cupredoxin domain-containing protein [Frankia sp.]
MGGGLRTRLATVAAFVLAVGAAPFISPAHAATGTVTTAALNFIPPTVTIAPGDALQLQNVDPLPHNVASTQTDKAGRLLFSSDTISAGQMATVRGVPKLRPGSYPFICSVHPFMHGTLNVGSVPLAVVPVATGGVVASPTSITVFGDSLYAASYASGIVQRLTLLPGGALAPATPYATGFSSPLGIAFATDGTLFVSESHAAGAGTVGRVRAVPKGGGDVATAGRVVVDNLPNGRHNTNGLAVHGSRLYIANGNSTDDGVTGGPAERPLSGTLISVPLSARNIDAAHAPKSLVVEARGMRNLFDVAFRPATHEAWIPTNGPDALDPYGEDLLNMLDVREPRAVDFGFPGCVYKQGTRGPEYKQNPAVAETHPCSPRHRRPEALLGLHVSADGLAFGPGSGPWGGDLYIAEYGNNPGETNAGHQVVRVPIINGHAGAPQQLVAGATPLDVAFGPAGLYVADFGSGLITLLQAVS